MVFSTLPPRGDAALRAPSVSPSLPTGIYHNCSCTYGRPQVKGCFVSKSCVEIPCCREQKSSSPREQNILSLQRRLEKATGTGGASSLNSPLAIACLVGRLCSSDQPGCADACYCSNKLHKKCKKLFSFLFGTIFIMAKTCRVPSESRDLDISPVDTPFLVTSVFTSHHHKLRKRGHQLKQLKNNFGKILHTLQLTSTCVSPTHRGH